MLIVAVILYTHDINSDVQQIKTVIVGVIGILFLLISFIYFFKLQASKL